MNPVQWIRERDGEKDWLRCWTMQMNTWTATECDISKTNRPAIRGTRNTSSPSWSAQKGYSFFFCSNQWTLVSVREEPVMTSTRIHTKCNGKKNAMLAKSSVKGQNDRHTHTHSRHITCLHIFMRWYLINACFYSNISFPWTCWLSDVVK